MEYIHVEIVASNRRICRDYHALRSHGATSRQPAAIPYTCCEWYCANGRNDGVSCQLGM